MRHACCVLAAVLALSGCSEPGPEDLDGDGWSPPRDCDDLNAGVFPGNGEACDELDNDCDGYIDEGFDEDADGFNTCGADRDCDDTDNDVYPGAEELCEGSDNDCDGVVDEGCEADGDGDGYLPSIDCDDTNPAIHPDAEELCNGIDDDCDDAIDEGFDGDGDGWSYCDGVDCDDNDPAIHPGAAEVCDGDDEDCDALIDEDFDVDGDGWTTCHEPPDCDDAVASTHPLAPEQCNGLDDDCDGAVDEDTNDDLDGDGVSACNGDCNDSNPAVYPGAVELPNGLDDDCSGGVDDGYSGSIDAGLFSPQVTGTVTQGRLGDVFGTDGLFNGDVLSDVVTGSATHDGGRGRAYLLLGESFAVGSPPASIAPFATVTGAASGDYLGSSVDLGDINDDGFDDWIIGSPELGSVDPPKGAVYIFFGEASPASGEYTTASADVTIVGGFPTEQCGTAVAALGDIDGDGIGDLGFTCPWFNPGDGNLRGRTVIFFGRASWANSYTSDDGDASLIGEVSDVESGQALVGDFDMNGDGLADVVVGSANWDAGSGRAVLFLGRPAASWTTGMSFYEGDRKWTGHVSLVMYGGSFLATGDADGDPYGDLLVGAPEFYGVGQVALIRGGATLPLSGYAMGIGQFYVVGDSETEQVGASAGLLDIDGDGEQDLVYGIPGWDGDQGGDQGRVGILYGPLTAYSDDLGAGAADALLMGSSGGDFFGGAMVVAEDFNAGVGVSDLFVSSSYNDAGAANGGRIYFVPGF